MSRKRKEKWWQVFRTHPDYIWWEAQDSSGNWFWNEIRLGQPESDYKSWRMLIREMTQTLDYVLDNGYTVMSVKTGQSRGGITKQRNERGVV
jgi:hypothetical protein